jgi:hypothetical protein
MHKIDLLPAHSDDRGKITDLIVGDIDSVTMITFSKDSIRGNHVHSETTQWTYVVKGEIEAFSVDKLGLPVSCVFKPGEMFVSLPSEPHAMRALIESEIIVFTRGPRSGQKYESDTVRYKLI